MVLKQYSSVRSVQCTELQDELQGYGPETVQQCKVYTVYSIQLPGVPQGYGPETVQ